MKICQICFVF